MNGKSPVFANNKMNENKSKYIVHLVNIDLLAKNSSGLFFRTINS